MRTPVRTELGEFMRSWKFWLVAFSFLFLSGEAKYTSQPYQDFETSGSKQLFVKPVFAKLAEIPQIRSNPVEDQFDDFEQHEFEERSEFLRKFHPVFRPGHIFVRDRTSQSAGGSKPS